MSNITPFEHKTETMADDITIRPGQYWQARTDLEKGIIPQDTVLLLQEVKMVDGHVHTVVMRAHPSLYDREAKDNEGNTHYNICDHQFLVNQFLEDFRLFENHETWRGEEIETVQAEIAAIQNEMLSYQKDSKKLDDAVLEMIRRETPEIIPPSLRLTDKSIDLSVPINPDMGDVITEEKVEEMKAVAEFQSDFMGAKSTFITEFSNKISGALGELTPFYEEQAAAAIAGTSEIQAQVKKMRRGIESLDLYLLKGVETMTIKEGKSADSAIPLTFVQKKMIVEQELALFVDVSDWFDFNELSKFFKALEDHEELVNQIFPTQRCIVVMSTAERDFKYEGESAYESAMKRMANEGVFMAIRDGDNIHIVDSPISSHYRADKLFPSQSDQDDIFRGADGSQITYEDVRYADRLSSQDDQILHYKRFLLLACGLDHKHDLFGPFYPGQKSLDFMTLEFQQKYINFIADDNGTNMMPAEERMSIRRWIAQQNKYLTAGSRIVSETKRLFSEEAAPAAYLKPRWGFRYDEEKKLHYTPVDQHGVHIVRQRKNDYVIDVPVSGYSYRNDKERQFDCTVALSKFFKTYNEDTGSLRTTYLCLDSVTIEDLDWYIHNRSTRSSAVEDIYFLKFAKEYLQQERTLETEARLELSTMLSSLPDASPEKKEQAINTAIRVWRAHNRGKPLPRITDKQWAKTFKLLAKIMTPFFVDHKILIDQAEAWASETGYKLHYMALTGAGRIALYAAPKDEERDDRVLPFMWIHKFEFSLPAKLKGGMFTKLMNDTWVEYRECDASEMRIHQWALPHTPKIDIDNKYESYDERKHLDPVFYSHEMKTIKLGLIDKGLAFLTRLSEAKKNGDGGLLWDETYAFWDYMHQHNTPERGMVHNPGFAVPIGLTTNGYGKLRYICVYLKDAAALLFWFGDDDQRADLKNDYINRYANNKAGTRAFSKIETNRFNPTVRVFTEDAFNFDSGDIECFYHKHKYSGAEEKFGAFAPILGPSLYHYVYEQEMTWGTHPIKYLPGHILENMTGPQGTCLIDRMLGLNTPSNFSPTMQRRHHLTVRCHDSGKTIEAFEFIDIFAEGYEYEHPTEEPFFKRIRQNEGHVLSLHTFTEDPYETYQDAHKAITKEYEGLILEGDDLSLLPQTPKGVTRFWLRTKEEE